MAVTGGNYVEERALESIDRRFHRYEQDHSTREGAKRLAARLREFWGADSGIVVTVIPTYPYGVRSNLVNGLPPALTNGGWVGPSEVAHGGK